MNFNRIYQNYITPIMGMYSVCFLTYLLCGISKASSPCGPRDLCSCDDNEMDCSNTGQRIQDVCDFIHNQTMTDPRSRVTRLLVERNGYTSVSDSSARGCALLYELSLANNNIKSIQSVNLTTLEKLRILNLNQNNFRIYEGGYGEAFLVTKYLHSLSISGNKRPRRKQHMRYPNLSYFHMLKEVSIDGLPNIPVALFDDLNSLEALNINGFTGHCFLNKISKHMFPNSIHVRVLNISKCNISAVEFGSFMELPDLQTLDVSYNDLLTLRYIENISYGLQFTNIRSLNVSKLQSLFGIGTTVRKRDVCYLWNTSLEELVINRNRIQVIESNVFILFPRTLAILRVNDNIQMYGQYVGQLPCLENMVEFNMDFRHKQESYSMYLNESHYDYFKDCEYEPPSSCPFLSDDVLRRISANVTRCKFYEINDTSAIYQGFPKSLIKATFKQSALHFPVSAVWVLPPDNILEYLDFSGNTFPILNGPVGPLMNLKFLNLSNTFCSNIRSSMFEGNLRRLENLQLQHNLLGLTFNDYGEEKSVFRSLHALKVLNLSMNYINNLPHNIFSNLDNLETIDLGYNNIQEWTADFHDMTNLTNLYLPYNFIETLPLGLTEHLVTVSTRRGISFSIDMRYNAIVASCQNQIFLEWMVKHRTHMIDFKDYWFEDDNMKRISASEFIFRVNHMGKNCASYTVLIVFTSICLVVFITICVGVLLYRNRWNIRYLIYMTKRRFWEHHDTKYRRLNEDYKFDVFISYDEEDRLFVTNEMVPYLERNGITLCIHERDFKFGRPIPDSINEAIQNSRYTVCILSNRFLKSRWCMYEFHMARMENIYSRSDHNSLLVIKYGKVVMKNMTQEMIKWLQDNTYLEYSQEESANDLFWSKLKDALNAGRVS